MHAFLRNLNFEIDLVDFNSFGWWGLTIELLKVILTLLGEFDSNLLESRCDYDLGYVCITVVCFKCVQNERYREDHSLKVHAALKK